MSNTLASTCRQTIGQMQTWRSVSEDRGLPQTQVWVQAAGAWEAMCACCAEVHSWVFRLGVFDMQGEMFGRLIQKNSESLVFFFGQGWMNVYKELGTFSKLLLIPREVVWGTVWITAVDNRAASLLDTQGRRMLLHLLSLAEPCAERKGRRKEKRFQVILLQNSLLLH